MSTNDLALIADTGAIEVSGDPAAFVVLACERAKGWLTQAVEHGDIDQIVELKSQAEAIRIYTTQKQLGIDAELAAAEIVRRAERGLGVAIRRGQAEQTIRRKGASGGPKADYERVRYGQVESVHVDPRHEAALVSPNSYFSSKSERTAVYAITDGVSDAEFEEAVSEAKVEGNLSRANVGRKVAVMARPSSDSSVERLRAASRKRYDASQRPDVLRNTRHIDSNRVVEQTILHSGLSESVAEQIDYSALDRNRLEGWVSSLSDVIRSLTTLRNNLKKELTLG